MISYDPSSVAGWAAFIFFGSFIQLVQPKSRPWYEKLKKNPDSALPEDNRIFSLWFLWYLLMFFATIEYFRLYPKADDLNSAVILWCSWINILFNHLWTPLFFHYGKLALAAGVIVVTFGSAMVVVIFFGLQQAWVPFGLYLPVVLWLAVAMFWNANAWGMKGSEVPAEEMEYMIVIKESSA